MTKQSTTETIVVTVAYEIHYQEEAGRADALKWLDECPIEINGCGSDGRFGATRGKIISKIPLQEFTRE